MARAVTCCLAKVNPQLSAVDHLFFQKLPRLLGALDVDEVGVGEAAGLACTAVDGDTNVGDVLDVAEEVVKVLVGHLEGHVADEEDIAGRVVRRLGTASGGGSNLVELDDEVAALEDLHVEALDGGLGVVEVLVLHVGEAEDRIRCCRGAVEGKCSTYPRLRPRLSMTMETSSTSPKREKTRSICSWVTS